MDIREYYTKDGLDVRKLRTVYVAETDRVLEYDTRSLNFNKVKIGLDFEVIKVTRKDGQRMAWFEDDLFPNEMYADKLAAEAEVERELERLLARAESEYKEAQRRLDTFRMDNAPYLKPTSDRKPEKIGSVRI